MAYLVDSVSKAAKGNRTPPDWWQALRRAESRGLDESQEAMAILSRVQSEVFGQPEDCEAAIKERSGFASLGGVLRGVESK